MRKLLCIILVLSMLAVLPVSAGASDKETLELYAQSLIRYYYHHQDRAEDQIWDILQQMKTLDPEKAAVWEGIMADWSRVNSDLPLGEGVLPDGLPEDDSLCIVVLGYALREDGNMQEELVDRLVVALASAIKYPNAWVLVSGGQTSPVKGVTEAGRMAAWLKNKGLSEDRLILETASLSTTANAVNAYKMLNSSYPQVNTIALVTSDYHLSWSGAMFTTVSHYKSGYSGGRYLELAAAAVCDTGAELDSIATQAWGVSTITGIPFDENSPAPELYSVDRPTEPATEPAEPQEMKKEGIHFFWEKPGGNTAEETPEEAQEATKSPVPILMLALLAVAAYILTPKKPSKRRRRQRPKMNWDGEEPSK